MPLQNAKTMSGRALVVTIAVAAVLQLALAPQIGLFGGTFNFMVVAALVLSVCVEPGTAVYLGFFLGLFYDLTSAVPVGLMSLLLTIASYAASSATQGVMPGLNLGSMRAVALSIVAVNLANGLALCLIGTESSLLYSLGVHALASSVLDLVAAVPFLAAVASTVQMRGFSARGSSSATYLGSGKRTATKRSASKHAAKRASGKHGSRSGGTRYKL